MDHYYNRYLSRSIFLDSKNDANDKEDTSTDEEIDVGKEEPAPLCGEFAIDSDEEEDEETEDDDDEEEEEYIAPQFMKKKIMPARQNAKAPKTNKKVSEQLYKKRNHNTMERVRRGRVSICHDVLRDSMGLNTNVSRNRALIVARERINNYNARLQEVDARIEEYENKIRSLMNNDAEIVPKERNKYARR